MIKDLHSSGIFTLPINVYCDLDGVLCDFWGTVQRTFGRKHTDLYYADKKGFWKPINDAGEVFWAALPWLPGAVNFWKGIEHYNPIILTARSLHPTSDQGKTVWIDRNLGEGVDRIICMRSEKALFAARDVMNGIIPLLIDDQERNIGEWEMAGGRGVLHMPLITEDRGDSERQQQLKQDYEKLNVLSSC